MTLKKLSITAAIACALAVVFFVSSYTGNLGAQPAETKTIKKKVMLGKVRQKKTLERLLIVAGNGGGLYVGKELFVDADGREIALKVKMPMHATFLCSVTSGSFSDVRPDMWVYEYRQEKVVIKKEEIKTETAETAEAVTPAEENKAVEEQKKAITEDIKKNESKIEREISEITFITPSVMWLSNVVWRGADFYGTQGSAFRGSLYAAFFNYKLQSKVTYDMPMGQATKNFQTLNMAMWYNFRFISSSNLGIKGEYRLMPKGKEAKVSDLFTASASLNYYIGAGMSCNLSYAHDLYVNNNDGTGGSKYSDFYVRGQFNPYNGSFFASWIRLGVSLWAGYFNNKHLDLPSTVANEGRKGLSDMGVNPVLYFKLMEGLSVSTGYNLIYRPSSAFAVDGKTRHVFTAALDYRF